MTPFRLLPSYRDKIWGATALEPWFRNSAKPIGEVWFTFEDNATDLGPTLGELVRRHGPALMGAAWVPPGFPILTKFIFTTQRLSIQVHPPDDYARRHEASAGKTEMWYVLRAEPGAAIGIGLKRAITRQRMREAVLSGEIEELVDWRRTCAGDVIVVPAGSVHAIGAGLAVFEIQQQSDVTYRLYDYGRPRELHIEKAIDVAELGPHRHAAAPAPLGPGHSLLAKTPYFATELRDATAAFEYTPDHRGAHILAMIEGGGTLGGRPVNAGEVWIVPANAGPFAIAPSGRLRLLDTYVPAG